MIARIAAGVLAAFACLGQSSIKVQLVKQDWLMSQLIDLPQSNAERAGRLRALFETVGCKGDHLSEQRVRLSQQPNVLCKSPGESDDIILVGAHFDKVREGRGVVDNGTGAVLLPALFEALGNLPRHHTFLFAGFTDEEQGLVGSGSFAKSIPKPSRSRYRAMVNIDSLGLRPATVWKDHSHPKLLEWFEQVGGAMHLIDFRYVNISRRYNSDASSFINIDIPVIDFHSITSKTLPYLHSRKDSIEAVRADDYFASYRLIAYYLAYLDSQLKNSPDLSRKKQK
jgi:hypothetical protein